MIKKFEVYCNNAIPSLPQSTYRISFEHPLNKCYLHSGILFNQTNNIIASHRDAVNALRLAYPASALDDLNQVKMIGEKHKLKISRFMEEMPVAVKPKMVHILKTLGLNVE